MGGDHAAVAAHDLHGLERAAERARGLQHKALGPHADIDLPVAHAFDVQHAVLADVQNAPAHLTAEDVDGRRAQELGDEEIAGLVVHFLRLADLMYHALLHHDDQIGDAHGLLLVVGDKDRGDAGLTLDAADLLTGLQTQARVEVRERLVEQQDAGHLHQRAGDGHPLLLTAGHFGGLAVHELLDLDQARGLVGLFQHDLLGELLAALQVLQREEDVLPYGQMRIEGVILKHQTHAAVFGRQTGHVVLAEEDVPAGGGLQTADQVERGALAAAGGAQQADQLPVGDLEGEIADGDDFLALLAAAGELLGQMLQYDFHNIPSFAFKVRDCVRALIGIHIIKTHAR